MRNKNVRNLTTLALFVALIVLLGFTPLGYIPLGFINISILAIPVVIGTVVMGLKNGIILGACFALTSILRAFGIGGAPSSLVATLMAASPVYMIVMSLVPRLLIAVSTHFVYKLLENRLGSVKAVAPAAVLGSLTNTVFYLGLMLVFYVMAGIDTAPVLGLIGGTAFIAGAGEAIAAALISTPVVAALRKAFKFN